VFLNSVLTLKRLLKFHEAAHIVQQLYGVPHGIVQESLRLFYTNVGFKILKFSNRPSLFFPSIQLLIFLI
jgi:hypothetical protein